MSKKKPPAPPATAPLAAPDAEALLRWRLALGPEAEKVAPELGLAGLGAAGADVDGVDGKRLDDFDQALGFVYDEERRGGAGGARPYLPKWLGLLREFFDRDVVALVQNTVG
jgi:hypothetical protein